MKRMITSLCLVLALIFSCSLAFPAIASAEMSDFSTIFPSDFDFPSDFTVPSDFDFPSDFPEFSDLFSTESDFSSDSIPNGEASISTDSDTADSSTKSDLLSATDSDDGSQTPPLFYDPNGELGLTESQIASVRRMLKDSSDLLGVDLVVAVGNGKGRIRYVAADFYDDGGYREDGVLFFIDMQNREWYFLTSGFAIRALTDARLETMENKVIPYLSSGDYVQAISSFVSTSRNYITLARDGITDASQDDGGFDLSTVLITVFASFLIGLIIALICVTVMKGKLKSVHAQVGASQYTRAGSLNIERSRDLFLYRHVDRVRKPEPSDSSHGSSSTFRSSSGTSHGGRGGKF